MHARSLLHVVVVALACAASSATGATVASAYPNPGNVAGDTQTHDPSLLVKPLPVAGAPAAGGDPRYTVFGTGNSSLASNDRVAFTDSGPYFLTSPAWWAPYRPQSSNGLPQQNTTVPSANIWAPDVSFHSGKYWMYYAISSPGSRHSAIGLATSTTALPGTWTDAGRPVFTTTSNDDFNAIDPNLLVDANGGWWLTFGSYWSGIYTMSVDPQTGFPAGAPQHLAERPRAAGAAGPGIEGAFMYQHGGQYYLFASFGNCCDVHRPFDYDIRVGRSASPTGPFLDAQGTDMLNGGGTVVMAGHDNVVAPGGESVVHDDYFGSHDLLVYHYLDKRLMSVNVPATPTSEAHPLGTMTPMLGINFLDFSSGFPVAY